MAGSCFCSSKRTRPFLTVPMSVFKVTLIRPAEPHIPRPLNVIAAERNIIPAPLRGGIQNSFRRRAHQCPRSHDPHFPAESEESVVEQVRRPENHAQSHARDKNGHDEEQLVNRMKNVKIVTSGSLHNVKHLPSAKISA